MDADLGRLLDEEGEDLVERGCLGLDLARARARRRASPSLPATTSNSMRSTPVSSAARNDSSVFAGASACGAAVADPERAPVAPLERDHGGGLVGR